MGDSLLYSLESEDEDEAITWMSDLVRAVMDYTISLWDCRNGVMHGKDEAQVKMKEISIFLRFTIFKGN